VPVYRFYNFVTGHHFFTTSEAERENVLKESSDPSYGQPGPVWPFNYEGVGFNAYSGSGHTDAQAVFRFYSPSLDRHFFTASVEEAQEIRLTGVWNDEGVGFYGEIPG
jgi:serralysin